MGSLTLGENDTEITGNLIKYLDLNNDELPDDLDGDRTIEEGGTDLDKDGTTESDGEDIAIASYNNAITRINNYCKTFVTATNNEGVRNVGARIDTAGAYNSTNFDSWFKGTGSVKAGDMGYEQDLVKMSYFGISGTGADYWLASRYVSEGSDGISFSVSCVYSDGYFFGGCTVWSVDNVGNVDCNGPVGSGDPSCGVRPVIINPSGI